MRLAQVTITEANGTKAGEHGAGVHVCRRWIWGTGRASCLLLKLRGEGWPDKLVSFRQIIALAQSDQGW